MLTCGEQSRSRLRDPWPEAPPAPTACRSRTFRTTIATGSWTRLTILNGIAWRRPGPASPHQRRIGKGTPCFAW